MVLTWGCKYITIYQSIYLIFLFRPYAEFFTCSIQVDLLAILGDSIITIPNVDSKKVKKKKKKKGHQKMRHPGQNVSIMLRGKCREKFLIALEKNEAAVPKQNNTLL